MGEPSGDLKRKCVLNNLANMPVCPSPKAGHAWAEAAAVSLEQQQHKPGVEMLVVGHFDECFSVLWEPVNETARRTWNDQDEAVEYGATGITALLFWELTPYHFLNRARKGSRVDFYLYHKDNPIDPTARIEISGIAHGKKSEISSRLSLKKKQVKRNPSSILETYISIVEFGSPCATIAKI
ncbi:MAG: hypothetical protein NTX50_03000 [Candidatus Sumerlaeota bacterium]|nr:hypothetical protein [Candidatus Sumerlaeota bacterium]